MCVFTAIDTGLGSCEQMLPQTSQNYICTCLGARTVFQMNKELCGSRHTTCLVLTQFFLVPSVSLV